MVFLNKKAQANVFIALMLGVVFFVLGIAFAPGTNEVVSDSLDQMNCTTNYLTNDSITNQARAVCVQIDSFNPLVSGLFFGFAGLVIGAIALR